jgi:hypothetical protein
VCRITSSRRAGTSGTKHGLAALSGTWRCSQTKESSKSGMKFQMIRRAKGFLSAMLDTSDHAFLA